MVGRMRLPEELGRAVEELSEGGPEISRASSELSKRYRERDFRAAALRTPAERSAYLLVRMPATFAACYKAFTLAKNGVPGFAPKSVLDLGAGPGTATWAANVVFPTLEKATLVERDAAMVEAGRKMMVRSEQKALQDARWVTAELSQEAFPASDLVVMSYVVGELSEGDADRLARKALDAARQMLVVVEPGTKAGFATIDRLRKILTAEGTTIAAPCPHAGPCPMAEAGDWCHFSQRLERTSAHRRIKGGELGHEDEKFSFVAVARNAATPAKARVVRHPMFRPKLVRLSLCTQDGLKTVTVTKSQGEAYKAARDAEWGDSFDL